MAVQDIWVYIQDRRKELSESYGRIFSQKRKKRTVRRPVNWLVIASILDEFSFSSFSKECTIIPITPENWLIKLLANEVDFLFVESAWHGSNNAWEYKVAKYNDENLYSLKALLNFCRQAEIPTVFWNKEDPVHYARFVETATLFDYIFTTDANKVPDYKRAVGHDNVFPLPFAAQHRLHNPIRRYERIKGVSFAGSYYGNRHEARRMDMDNTLAVCSKYNLTIYDRNISNPDPAFKYPEKYQPYVAGMLPYSEIDKSYKGYRVMMNVNSIKDSPTMFSRRVFEGLASGTPVVSSYSLGIELLFGELVDASDDVETLDARLERLMNDNAYYRHKSLQGIRTVMLAHTYTDRLFYISSKVGLPVRRSNRRVAVMAIVDSAAQAEAMVQEFGGQAYTDKELILLFKSQFDGYLEAMNRYNSSRMRAFLGYYVENHFEMVGQITDAGFIAPFFCDNSYGPHYLEDLLAACLYSGSYICGKGCWYAYKASGKLTLEHEENEYTYVEDLLSDRCMFQPRVFASKPVTELLQVLERPASMAPFLPTNTQFFSSDSADFIADTEGTALPEDVLEKADFFA